MKTISQKRKQKNDKRIKKPRGFITIQNSKAEKKNRKGKVCNQKGAFG